MKAVVAAFNQEKALVGAFSVITSLRMELFEALLPSLPSLWLSSSSLTDASTTRVDDILWLEADLIVGLEDQKNN